MDDEAKARRGGCRTLIDLTGRTFTRPTVIRRVKDVETISRDRWRPMWLCECECGNQCVVLGDNLRSGKTKSCGCLRKEKSAENGRKAREALRNARAHN